MRKSLILLAVVAACGKGSGGDKAASVDLFGKKPVPPGELTKVTADMTQAQFKAAFPKAYKTPNHSGSPSLSIDSGYADIKYRVGFYSDIDKVADISVEVPKDFAKKLEAAWGAPTGKGTFGGPAWKNDEAGYRAEIMEMGRRTDVRFTPFTPLTAAYFGSAPGLFDDLAKLKLGMTRDEVKAAAPSLSFPPKGGGAYTPNKGKAEGVQFDLRFGYDDDKLEGIQITIPEKGVELLTKAWGAAKAGKIRGDNAACQQWQSADKAMRFELRPEGHAGFGPDSDTKFVDMSVAAPDHSFCDAQ